MGAIGAVLHEQTSCCPFTTLNAFFILLKHLSFLDEVVLLKRLAYTGQVALAE